MGFDITHVYGLTEMYGPASVCAKHPEWDELDIGARTERNGRQGVRYTCQEGMTVLDPETMQPVPWDGETMGEIMFRGNITMKGYLKNPQTTDEAFAGGWYHTGDLAVMQPDGYVKIKDRSKDIIISGGENISSIEVEDALYRHPERADGRGRRAARPEMGRDAVRVRGTETGAQGRRKATSSCIATPTSHASRCRKNRVRRRPEDVDRQDPEIPAARARPVDVGDCVAGARPPPPRRPRRLPGPRARTRRT